MASHGSWPRPPQRTRRWDPASGCCRLRRRCSRQKWSVHPTCSAPTGSWPVAWAQPQGPGHRLRRCHRRSCAAPMAGCVAADPSASVMGCCRCSMHRPAWSRFPTHGKPAATRCRAGLSARRSRRCVSSCCRQPGGLNRPSHRCLRRRLQGLLTSAVLAASTWVARRLPSSRTSTAPWIRPWAPLTSSSPSLRTSATPSIRPRPRRGRSALPHGTLSAATTTLDLVLAVLLVAVELLVLAVALVVALVAVA